MIRWMKIPLMALTLAAAGLPSGCSQSECEAACEKQKGCLEALDCSKLDANEQAGCTFEKQLFGSLDCSALSDCSADAEKTAKQFNGCALDSRTCSCAGVQQTPAGG